MDNDMISMFDPLHEATIEGMKQIVFPTVFKMIAPLLILFLIFSILKMILVKRVRNEKAVILVKGIVDILFWLSILLIEPAVIKNISIPTKIDIPAIEDSGINPFANPNKGAEQDESSEYDGFNPFENPNKGTEQDESSEYDGFNPFENPNKGTEPDESSEYDGINPFENPNKGAKQDENSEYDGINPFENPNKQTE